MLVRDFVVYSVCVGVFFVVGSSGVDVIVLCFLCCGAGVAVYSVCFCVLLCCVFSVFWCMCCPGFTWFWCVLLRVQTVLVCILLCFQSVWVCVWLGMQSVVCVLLCNMKMN